jgi:hypothetical protein
MKSNALYNGLLGCWAARQLKLKNDPGAMDTVLPLSNMCEEKVAITTHLIELMACSKGEKMHHCHLKAITILKQVQE